MIQRSIPSSASTASPARVPERVHLVGIGGTGLAGLARIYLEMGLAVTGSDSTESAVLDELRRLGATVFGTHAASNLPADAERVVVSAAIPSTNPEWVLARARGLAVEKYSEALARLVNEREAVAVAGTHGKTTVTAWVAHLLRRAGRDAGYLVGGTPLDLEGSGHVGRDPAIVVEACEYDRTFLRYRPAVAVINNIEEDHLDYYTGFDEIVEAFREFVGCIRPGGVLAAPVEALRDLRLPEGGPRSIVTIGSPGEADIAAEAPSLQAGNFAFTLRIRGRSCGPVRLGVPGIHNVRNALAVAAVGSALGIGDDTILDALAGFRGVMRRIHRLGAFRGVPVLDDYAHHPTEVRATITAVRESHPDRRIWAVFQPHQYSRTRRFLGNFSASFSGADKVIVTEIYRAREEADPALSGAHLAEGIRGAGGDALFIPDLESVVRFLRNELQPSDLVLTMGAGDVTRVSHDLVA